MPYAVLQQSLDPPSPDELRRAFKALPSLTDLDAVTMAKDAYGIIVGGLTSDDAGRLSRALAAEGVECEVVEEARLMKPPPPRSLKRADCLPNALVVYDALGRPAPVDWAHLVVIAAGSVWLTEFKRTERERVTMRGFSASAGSVSVPITEVDVSYQEQRNQRLVLDLLLDVEPVHYRVQASNFRFDYLAERRTHLLSENFVLLVLDLLAYAPHTLLNRGAQTLKDDPTQILE